MLKLRHYYTIKTLLEQKKNISEIRDITGISRKTIRKVRNKLESGEILTEKGEIIVPKIERKSMFDPYKEKIKDWLIEKKPRTVILKKLKRKYGRDFKYSSLNYYINSNYPNINKEVYVPVITEPGKEAQVDFGYLGYFKVNIIKIN